MGRLARMALPELGCVSPERHPSGQSRIKPRVPRTFQNVQALFAKAAVAVRAQGYEVREEMPIGGRKTVDVVATKDGKRVAIEIETGKSDPEENVRKCREAGFSEAVCVRTPGYYLQR